MARSCEDCVAAMKKAMGQEKTRAAASERGGAAALDFLRRALDRVAVRRDGAVVTVHADVASGFNALLSAYGNEMAPGKK
jgi:hypothetical protein